jgi:hypothetical protein
MVEPIGAIGVLICIVSDYIDAPIDSKWSILAEKLSKTTSSTTERLKSIELKIDNQVFGHMRAAEMSLNNALSDEFSFEEKVNLINKAQERFEDGYSAFGDIEEFGLYKAETSVYIAVCHLIQNRPKLAKKWFFIGKENFQKVKSYTLPYSSKKARIGGWLKITKFELPKKSSYSDSIDYEQIPDLIVDHLLASPFRVVNILSSGYFSSANKQEFDNFCKINDAKKEAKLALEAFEELEPDLEKF